MPWGIPFLLNMASYVEDLERMIASGCQTPGCTHKDHGTLFLHGKCHFRGTVEVSYTKDSGEILVACAECQKEIARIAVARRTLPDTIKN